LATVTMDDYDWYLDHTSPVKPPPGHESNFVNPESISYQLITVISVMTALVVLSTAGRVYTRLRITKSFGLDDCKSRSSLLYVTLAGL